MINSRTGLYGLIGEPVAHSISPVMQNAAFVALGLDYVYLAFAVNRRNIDLALAGCRALGIRGLNVTVPYKKDVLPYLDEINPEAERIGAVNTIVNSSGKLCGHNTDSIGFKIALLDSGFKPAGKNVVLLGVGGAARAIAFSLIKDVAGLIVITRKGSLEKGHSLAAELGPKALARDINELEQSLSGAELLVNATGVGMAPRSDETLVPRMMLRPGLTVFDVIYNPAETRLLREAAASGCQIVSGVNMLVYQGAFSFEIWTGKAAPVDVMKSAVKKTLQEINAANINKIVLIGFMGSGKSAVAKVISRRLGRPLLDTDSIVEQKADMTVNEIFASNGEQGFRQLETEAVIEACSVPDAVISCGGGAVLEPGSVVRLKNNGFIVYLKCSPRTLLNRVGSARNRPLLAQESRLETINALLSERDPLYFDIADYTIDTSNIGIEAIADAIIRRFYSR